MFLDEMGELPMSLQAKLLRFLQERVIERVGGREEIAVNVRVVCATHQDLENKIAQNEFREEVYYRINEITVNIPALKEREGDVLLLARSFLDSFNKEQGKKIKGFTKEAMRSITEHDWPGNVRELKNVIERCVVLANTDLIGPEHLPQEICGGQTTLSFVERRKNARLILPENGISLEEVEKDLIKQALERTGNNQTKTAQLLNISYDTLRYQVKKHKLK